MYTKESRPTDRKTLPAEPENILEELKVRPKAERAEQLSLLSPEELTKLQCPPDSDFARRGEMQSSDTKGSHRPRRTKDSPVQLKLPGF